ncbi:hypothetical protein F11_18360 [Rhodospirillum rubrum F11]|uniref:Uncharacterized protein n=1 Tax=Rhodospirillum rubrum (strain ATCC 11170 / ATH 1.1.1 / DSM 467 / LMG 4362 / NCIMB 8255 / S1) TaxID=269796 RepID=Q2RNB4_RHORT|nr:hypothetical protein [Rhodospirillum rubrum]ABC24381.1 hypothetical protein Rru_A3587 [Rhodospirillum rubrum ATCC 11170]AEO50132.1 hypothetical protein F11_18360 [Rhodospirillum rubrum F11]QXG80305.1 hypothetical protein KUL73_18515 [Rhodospirillum rubrum]
MSVSLLPSLLPFALAVAGAGLAGLVGRLLGRAELGDRLAGLGIVLGLGAGWLWLGGPAVPTIAADWAIAAGALATAGGVVADALRLGRGPRLLALGLGAVAGGWVMAVAGGVAAGLSAPTALLAWGLTAAAWIGVLLRLEGRGASAPVAVLAAALGLGGVAWALDNAPVMGLAPVLICALLGWVLWSGLRRLAFSATACAASAGFTVALATAMALDMPGALPALAVGGLCLFADGTAARLVPPRRRKVPRHRLLVHAGLSLAPLPIALALALIAAGMPAH